ncbi:zinc ribbon domain-containing protein [bacterium]|nr:zinc ribbon domain-containing protein [bacterium]
MPLFEYKCNECGAVSEILVRSAADKPVCSCGSEKLTKLFSAFAVSEGSSAAPSCADGRCGAMPNSPCASGMCGL